MASQNSVRQAVLRVLSDRSIIRGRNPFGTLCNAVGEEGIKGRDLVDMALKDLALQGLVLVSRDHLGKITAISHVKPRRHVDRTELSAQEKRERMFAKGVPAFLPDDLCSEVTVSYAPGRGPNELVFRRDMPVHERMMLCLRALRQVATKEGVSADVSARTAVESTVTGITRQLTRQLTMYLRALDLMVDVPKSSGVTGTKSMGPVVLGYIVDLDVEMITPEMVERAMAIVEARRAAKRVSKQLVAEGIGPSPDPSDDDPDNFSGPDDDVQPHRVTLPSTADTAIDYDDDVTRLVAVVVALEEQLIQLRGKLERRDSVIADKDAFIAELNERVEDLTAECGELRRSLDEALRPRPTARNPKVDEILARHRSI